MPVSGARTKKNPPVKNAAIPTRERLGTMPRSGNASRQSSPNRRPSSRRAPARAQTAHPACGSVGRGASASRNSKSSGKDGGASRAGKRALRERVAAADEIGANHAEAPRPRPDHAAQLCGPAPSFATSASAGKQRAVVEIARSRRRRRAPGTAARSRRRMGDPDLEVRHVASKQPCDAMAVGSAERGDGGRSLEATHQLLQHEDRAAIGRIERGEARARRREQHAG